MTKLLKTTSSLEKQARHINEHHKKTPWGPPIDLTNFCIKILSLAPINVHAETVPTDAAEVVGKYALSGPHKLNFLH